MPLVRRFGGTVDKFLGDGIMVTFGTQHADPLDPLNALRTAILCQETLRRLREEGKTYFKMGIAIHYGRVYLARFIADDEDGAGRPSSAATSTWPGASPRRRRSPWTRTREPRAAAAGPGPRPPGCGSPSTATGTLFNEGIAISRDTLVQLEAHLPLVHSEEDGGRA